jgi:hypothetical protein
MLTKQTAHAKGELEAQDAEDRGVLLEGRKFQPWCSRVSKHRDMIAQRKANEEESLGTICSDSVRF